MPPWPPGWWPPGPMRSSSTPGAVLDVSDIERVHDMRVATRRLRAALEVFRPCFPRAEFKATLWR